MELRHLETLIAIEEEGTFTAAADLLSTVQSNVSEQIRQLEAELGVTLLARGRSGATPTESGEVVLQHARRIRREIELMREDVAALQGLQVGRASFGIVGTASRWLVPALVSDLRRRAPGIELRVNEGASERLLAEVLAHELGQAVITEPVRDERLNVEHLLDEGLVGLAPPGTDVGPQPVPFAHLADLPLVLPPAENPLRIEIEEAARQWGVTLQVRVEVEGIRLIADLVAAGAGASVLPQTAIPPELNAMSTFTIAGVPHRRLALISPKAVPLSLADRAVRETVLQIVGSTRALNEARARTAPR
jgi:LysR family transcriptional regulator, nitrogen assimilation regulatory protein